jgi:hypothetical protein
MAQDEEQNTIIERASKRFNTGLNSVGMMTRDDVYDFLDTLTPEQDKVAELHKFVDRCGFMGGYEKDKLFKDLPSYGL